MNSFSTLSLSGFFNTGPFTWDTVTFFLGGMGLTCLLIIGALSLGLVLGLVMASFQVYGPRFCGLLVSLYVWFFRGVPILVLMYLFYFGLASQFESLIRPWLRSDLPAPLDSLLRFCFGPRGNVSPFACAVVVLGLCSAAYQSQIFRGAMKSIPAGQFMAAKALGMSSFQAVRVIILPQVLRISIPAWSNEYSILLKDSGIAFVIGTMETMARFKAVASSTYYYLSMYILAGLAYFVITWVGVRLLLVLYDRVRVPGLAEVHSADIV